MMPAANSLTDKLAALEQVTATLVELRASGASASKNAVLFLQELQKITPGPLPSDLVTAILDKAKMSAQQVLQTVEALAVDLKDISYSIKVEVTGA
jgi:hypothetical protein